LNNSWALDAVQQTRRRNGQAKHIPKPASAPKTTPSKPRPPGHLPASTPPPSRKPCPRRPPRITTPPPPKTETSGRATLALRWNQNTVILNEKHQLRFPLAAFFEQNGWNCVAAKLPSELGDPHLTRTQRLLHTLTYNTSDGQIGGKQFVINWEVFQNLLQLLAPTDIDEPIKDIITGLVRLQKTRQSNVQTALPDFAPMTETLTKIL